VLLFEVAGESAAFGDQIGELPGRRPKKPKKAQSSTEGWPSVFLTWLTVNRISASRGENSSAIRKIQEGKIRVFPVACEVAPLFIR